ncbi:MAG: hypothetical protein ACD_81C00185G0015 [uncultured bacterium]|uniref:Uncharacterized protein n=2 Tax=Candidatus Wolfeibacteriota TaxID=1752735 RepID=A0A0G1JIE2_9BACT|nr:MAG: hypothetical protein ACD_81C00185G0015 [uncultured bacterium]KKR12821.1 MAG: hypothetical protein UT41_C0001G0365 [Candidatus Wolfebacteria bacterium GW2011_GWC2_39_22]KKT43752.1 MAG: hypothetical protein UW32_C0001G0344 [Candidatus Wolfebacteria bacterium GW2011_GWE2_44_13]HBI25517.1 hypothetical protein [Candidatus Wolfebacteria bacterium]
MSKNRSSCPPTLEKKLNREVHYRCPICGNFPLVRAHTIKLYAEVGWHYDYLLAICIACEKKVENGEIERNTLHTIKNSIKKSFSETTRNKPYQIAPIIGGDVYVGSNYISSVNIIFAYRGLPILWFEDEGGVKTLNARFYDVRGTVITAIDKNMWTADRNRFYDIEVDTSSRGMDMEIMGRSDDTHIKFTICDKGIILGCSEFYIPGEKIKILEDGTLNIGTNKFSNNSILNCAIAFNFD